MRKYGAAWGIGIGWIVGALIGIPLDAVVHLATTFSLVGLIIGYVLSQQQETATGPSATAPKQSTSERLKDVEKLRSESLITEEEYQAKRKQILGEL
jgi:hypothetical protein